MKFRFPIYAQILAFLTLHLAVLAILFSLVFNTQSGPGWDPLMNGPLGDRFDTVSWVIGRQTQGRPPDQWNGILDACDKHYRMTFAIFDHDGRQLAGVPLQLPEPVFKRITMHPPRPPRLGEFDKLSAGSDFKPEALEAMRPRRMFARPRGPSLIHTDNPSRFWFCAHLHMRPVPGGPQPLQLVGMTDNLWQTKVFSDITMFLVAVGATLALSALIWLPFVWRITSAVTELQRITEKIAEGQFDSSLRAHGIDEIGSLTESINKMAYRLNDFVSGQKRFLGDIAHELCSPIARLQVALEILEASANSQQELVVRDIREEVDEMRSLINELLAFSKAGLQGRETPLSHVNLSALCESTTAKICSETSTRVDVPPGLVVLGDPMLLERAISNVLRNAVRYAASAGPISLRATDNGNQVILVISDSGPGVPPGALQMLGQPFYRPEPSRSRDSGGVGLGLAIVKSCVEACGGTFSASNNEPSGLKVELRLAKASAAIEVETPPAPSSVA